MKQYPHTLAKIRKLKAGDNEGRWNVAFALWEEVAKDDQGRALRGEIVNVQDFLKREDGDDYSRGWLANLHVVGGWAGSYSQRIRLLPVRMAMVARSANLTVDEAMTQWALGADGNGGQWSLRTWAAALGQKWSDTKADTAAELAQRAVDLGITAADIADAVLVADPDAAAEAAKNPDVRRSMNEAMSKAVHDRDLDRDTFRDWKERNARDDDAYVLSASESLWMMLRVEEWVMRVEEVSPHTPEAEEVALRSAHWLTGLANRLEAWGQGITEPMDQDDFEAGVRALLDK